VSYRVLIKNSAKPDIKKLGSSYLRGRFLEIVDTLKDDPYRPTDSFKKLLPYHNGFYSRRLNQQHRVVYKVNEQKQQVEIYSAWNHYRKLPD
jgi:Txe/YoeB family toxin of toxin-antitoxin system